MKAFAALFRTLDQTTSTNKKVAAIKSYLEQASDKDKVWTIALFSHKRPRRTVTTTFLRKWAAEEAELPLWLFEETYHIVGDLAETIAKVVPTQNINKSEKSLTEWLDLLISLREETEERKRQVITAAWQELDADGRYLFNKLITGGFRVGVSQKTIVKALALLLEQDEALLAHKLMGNWDPATTSFQELLLTSDPRADLSKPYPFYLASPLEKDVAELGRAGEWYAEYKWDGMRGQLIKRADLVSVWSRGEELITAQFPEFEVLAGVEDDFVIDGELLVMLEGKIQGFDHIQKRIGRKTVSKKLRSTHPVIMMVYDLMEQNGQDLRAESQEERRRLLEELITKINTNDLLLLSPLIAHKSWDEVVIARGAARAKEAEGLMLKSKIGEYKTGRKRGDWYKWKLDPMTFDAVMLYAQRGHGRRANLFSDFTFAVWDGDNLVPVTKSYIGLTDAELTEITSFVKKNTRERFGPVSSVTPELVFEIGFEGISYSKRRKVGISLRSPRILRWRRDKTVKEIDNLATLLNYLNK